MNAWTSGGKLVSSRGPTPIATALADPQLAKLDAMIAAATAARWEAARGILFDVGSEAGRKLTLATHDLFEIDALLDLANELGGPDPEITRDGLNEHEGDMRMGRSAR